MATMILLRPTAVTMALRKTRQSFVRCFRRDGPPASVQSIAAKIMETVRNAMRDSLGDPGDPDMDRLRQGRHDSLEEASDRDERHSDAEFLPEHGFETKTESDSEFDDLGQSSDDALSEDDIQYGPTRVTVGANCSLAEVFLENTWSHLCDCRQEETQPLSSWTFSAVMTIFGWNVASRSFVR